MFKKLFCRHDWKTHTKKVYEYKQQSIVNGTEYWGFPKLETLNISTTVEVLICKKCGKIKKIEY